MQVKIMRIAIVVLLVSVFFSCRKNLLDFLEDKNPTNSETPHYNLDVILRGNNYNYGLVKFRQDNAATKIVTLDTWLRDLKPNHSYLLQRAVDTELDGNCTSTAWLTLRKGSEPQAIETDARGTGRVILFRDLSAAASGTTFDIHFQIIDATTKAVVLASDCYTFTVR